jgi:hypothetical protein
MAALDSEPFRRMARAGTRILTHQEGRKIVRCEFDGCLEDDGLSWRGVHARSVERETSEEMMQQQSSGKIIMKGVTPVKKRPFTVYDLGGGSVEIVNWQERRARYSASDLDGIVACVKSFKPSVDPVWEASGERNPLESYLRRQGLRVFSGCLVAFLEWQGRLSTTQTVKGHIAAK